MDRDDVVLLWSDVAGIPVAEAQELIDDRDETLAALAAHDEVRLRRVGQDILRRERRLPLSTWLREAEADQRLSLRAVHESTEKRDLAKALLRRAVDQRIVIPGQPVSDRAIGYLYDRTNLFRLGGVVKAKRRWKNPPPLSSLTLPKIQSEDAEFLLSRILNWDGVFSLDAVGSAYITQQKGYQREVDERIYVDGVCRIVDDAADIFFPISPGGGRFRVTETAVSVVRHDRHIAVVEIG